MRSVIYSALLISLAGLAFEVSIFLIPVWFSAPISASLTEIDSVTGVGTFEFGDGPESVYIRIRGSAKATRNSGRLVVKEAGETSSFSLDAGERINLGNMEFRIETVRPWVGILPDPGGEALISISMALEEGVWTENLIFGRNGVLSIDEYHFRLGLLDGKTVEDFIEAKTDRKSRGRWGVGEGDRIYWFDSLIPGSGLELDDGTVYTLLEFREKHESRDGLVPEIAVRVEKEGSSSNRIVTTESEDDAVKLEYESGHQVWFVVSSDGEIEAVVFYADDRSERESLRIGDSWRLGQTSMNIRIEQYESSGVAVNLDQTPFQEVVLVSDVARVRVRQGEAVRVGDALLRYQRVSGSTALEYEVSLTALMEGGIRLMEGSGVTLVLGDTRYKIRYADVDMERGIVVYPLSESHPVRFAGFIVLGIAAFGMRVYRSRALLSNGSNSL